MIKELEKHFFKKTFSEIKKHPLFEGLSISNEEIIDNREKIKNILLSHELCTDKNYCKNISTHFLAARNEFNELIFKTYTCKKNKNFQDISAKTIDEQIEKLLTYSTWKFNNQDAKNCIVKIRSEAGKNDEDKKIIKDIDNLGTMTETVQNHLCVNNISSKSLAIFYAYFFILRNQYVTIIEGHKLQKIICDYHMNFSNNDVEGLIEKKFMQFLNIKNLIVVDFGYENEINIVNYFLDFLKDFLKKRYEEKKTTILITNVTIQEIFNNLFNNAKFKKDNSLQKKKVTDLKRVMIEIFCIKA